eukprot:1372475-Pleurochrysis_carterae.AAC.1
MRAHARSRTQNTPTNARAFNRTPVHAHVGKHEIVHAAKTDKVDDSRCTISRRPAFKDIVSRHLGFIAAATADAAPSWRCRCCLRGVTPPAPPSPPRAPCARARSSSRRGCALPPRAACGDDGARRATRSSRHAAARPLTRCCAPSH